MHALRLLSLLLLPALAGCGVALTDAATRFRFDVQSEAARLIASGETQRVFVHAARRFPEGCAGGYRLRVAASDPARTVATNDVYVGCHGNRNLASPGYTWATGLGEPLLPVQPPLEVDHPQGGDLRVTLVLEERGVRIAALEPLEE